MSKLNRLISSFLLSLFLLSCVSSGLIVSAASGNLVEQDLTEWESVTGNATIYTKDNDIYRVGIRDGYYDIIYDLPSFIAGHSYTLKFTLPSGDDIAAAWDNTYSDDDVINYYSNATVTVGYGFLSADGTSVQDAHALYAFTSDNISKYLGKQLTTTFVGGSSSGRPCLFINVLSSDTKLHLFFFQDFVLIDNDDNSGELTGIKGFLHSIRWDLIGGVCEDEDCPHSVDDNPHLSLTERMSAGFATLFDNIGSKFEEGSTLNVWFSDLSSGVTDLGDRVDGFFDGLGDRISGFFDNLKAGVTSGFSDVGDWFTSLGDNLSSWFDGVKLKFQEVGDSITAKFQEIGDKFTEFFDKFKPRVYIDLKWVRGYVDWNTGELKLRDDNNQYVVISDLFTVPKGTKYLLDYVDSEETYGFAIHKYDLNGNFISSDAWVRSFEGKELESGYCYRFRTSYTPGVADLSIVNDYVMLYSDEGWINALLYNFKTGIKNLFVPDEFYLTNFKGEVSKIFEDSLGFVYTFIDYVVQLFDTLQDIFSSVTQDDVFSFTLPKFEFDILGYHVKFWDDITILMDWLKGTKGIGLLYNVYKGMLHFMFITALINYGDKVYKDVTSSQ